MNENRDESPTKTISVLIVLVLVLIGLRVTYTHGINTDQYLDLIKTLSWPVVILIVLGSDKAWALLESFTELEFWGAKASKKGQQKEEASADTVSTSDEPVASEAEDFIYLDSFLVPNTKNALLWLTAQNKPPSQEEFLQHYTLPNAIDSDIAREKHVIFSVLLSRKLITVMNGVIEITPKGNRYLKHAGLTI